MRGETLRENVLDQNRGVEMAINAERNTAIQAVKGEADAYAVEEAARRRAALESGAKNYISFLKDQEITKKDTVKNFATALYAQGIDPTKLSPQELESALKNAKGINAQDIIAAYQTVKSEKLKDISKPATVQEYEYAKANGYTGSFTDYQNEDANRKSVREGLTPANINSTVNSIASAFDNEPIVKNFNVLKEGYLFAKNLSNTTTNPSDDQGLVYAFAKAMDPGSVVREGEYATVQKYAQSLIQSYGKSVTQAINGTGFLTPEARANIKKTIESKYNSSKTQYDNIYKEYQRQIRDAYSGSPRQITNYANEISGVSNTVGRTSQGGISF